MRALGTLRQACPYFNTYASWHASRSADYLFIPAGASRTVQEPGYPCPRAGSQGAIISYLKAHTNAMHRTCLGTKSDVKLDSQACN
eukprot:scaffold9876_cov20-Prasinocladus_malaysianus.AAC.1